ncbi:MAG: phosphate ABC transporter substrate-binding protein [Bdellovibrionales bacterium]
MILKLNPIFLILLLPLSLMSKTRIELTGSSTVAPVTKEIGRAFERLNPNTQVNIQTGGSSRGVADARRGLVDIGMASRSLKHKEKGLSVYTIALDGIGIIVNHQNSIKEIAPENIVKIYRGEIVNWKELGGVDQQITVVSKAAGRSTLELFLKYFNIKYGELKPQIIIGDNEQGIKNVESNSGAIGYVSIGAAQYSSKSRGKIKLLDLNGVKASVQTVRDGTYPLSRPLNLLTKSPAEGEVKEFIDFTRSAKARDIIESQYFVPVH